MGFLRADLRHLAQGAPRNGVVREARGLQVRGVVTAVYLPGDPRLAARRSPLKLLTPTITCDVLTFGQNNVMLLRDVPILRQSAGLVDNDTWVPRAASISLIGGVLVTASPPPPAFPLPMTRPEDMDGDHVLVGFVNGDLAQPVIMGQLDHPRTTRTPVFAVPPAYKRRVVLNGWSIGMTQLGTLSIDATLASAGVVTPTIPPVATPSPAAGSLNIALSATAKLSVGLAVAPSPTQEPVPLGRALLTDLGQLMTDLNLLVTQLSTALGALGMPLAAAPNVLADLTLIQTKITTSLSAGKPYLSITTEVD